RQDDVMLTLQVCGILQQRLLGVSLEAAQNRIAQPTQDDLNKFNSMLLPRQCNHSPLDVLFLDGHYSEMQIEILQPMMKLLFLILTELGIKKDDPSRFYDNNTALLETENGKRISTFRTTSTVKQGEPLLVSYVNDNDSYIMRQAKLRRGWFFTCKCHRCMQTIEAESKLKEQIEANIDYIRRMIQTKENNRMDVEKLNLLEQTKIADEEHLAGIGKQSNIKQKDPPSYFVCLKCLIPRYIIKEEQNAIQKLIEDKLVQIEQIKEIIEQFSVKRFEREQQKDMKKKIKEQIEAKEEKKFIQDIEQELKKLRESQIIKIERVKDNEEEGDDEEEECDQDGDISGEGID
ncbi:MAG: hypothetical protein EZS28_029647, partial [Streblomastix strix]